MQLPLKITFVGSMQLEHMTGEVEVHVAQSPWHPQVPLLRGYLFEGHVDTQYPLFK